MVLRRHNIGTSLGSSARRARVYACVAAVVCLAPVGLFPASFTATLDRDTVTVGESAKLSLSFEGGQPKEVPALPAIPNLRVTDGGYLQSSGGGFTVVINGRQVQSASASTVTTYNLILTPLQPGEFDIPALQAEVDGQPTRTQPLKLKAIKAATSPADPGAENQLAFVRLVLPKKEMYVGEVMALELQVYLHSVVQQISGFQFAPIQADGFSVGKVAQAQQRQERVGNTTFNVLSWLIPVGAVKSGQLKIEPITCMMALQLPGGRRSRDPFEDLGFGGLFSRFEQKNVTLSTGTEPLQALALPAENVPPGFNGAVGDFSLSLSAAPTNVVVGDPITVKIQVAGRGALDGLTLPPQSAWAGFKTYPPASKVETVDSMGLQGTKTFEQVLVPQSADIKALPPVTFSFFDPDRKGYRTLTHPAVPLVVRRGDVLPTPLVVTSASSENSLPAQDIVNIKQRPGVVGAIQPPLVQQPWFVALQSAPVLAWLGLFIRRIRLEQLANNPRLRRRRQVSQRVREGLAELRQLAEANEPDDFFAVLVDLLQEQIGERLDLPASAITEAVIEDQLLSRGVPENTLSALHELFQRCNLARYAPVKTSHELAALIPKLEDALRELRQIKI